MRFFGYFAQFSAKTLLDWVRPPPPFWEKNPKNLKFFLLRKFWIRRDLSGKIWLICFAWLIRYIESKVNTSTYVLSSPSSFLWLYASSNFSSASSIVSGSLIRFELYIVPLATLDYVAGHCIHQLVGRIHCLEML